jgi:hypothetical protein
MKYWILHIVLFFSSLVFSQNDMRLSDAEYRLEQKLNALRAAKGDSEIKAKNQELKAELEKTFEIEGAFDYPFDRLRTMGSIKSSDNAVRLFNWNIEHADFTHEYYCYVLYNDSKKKKVVVTELVDNSIMLPARPTETLTADSWYGALYYSIIPTRKKGKTYYTLLGWDGNTASSNIKLIDVMYFVGNKPKLGHNMFKMEDGVHKRIFFEHKEQAIMTMRYDHDRQMIVYDHLSPESPALKGFYSFYVPDMSYDGLEFMDDYWVLRSDIISTNKEDNRKKMTIYSLNDQKGQVEKVETKQVWNNPENPGAPVDNGKHTGVLPDVKQEVKAPKKVKTTDQQPGYTYPTRNKGKKSGPGSILQKGQ